MTAFHLTAADVIAIKALAEAPEEVFYSFRAIAAAGVPRHDVRRSVRRLKRLGWAKYASGLWTDDGEPAGAGYALTDAGRFLAQAMEARRAETGTGSVHDSAVSQGCAQPGDAS